MFGSVLIPTPVLVILTLSVPPNVNAILSHYNGILSYSNGKYVLSVETGEDTPTASITDGGTGVYVNNLTNAMANINYCMSTAGEHDAGSFASFGEYNHDSPNTTTASKVDYHATDGGARDVGNAGQVVHGDLA